MDVSFSLASQTLVVRAEAWPSFTQWDMEEDVCSYSAGWWENRVISKREHSAVKSSTTATALYHYNYIFQMQMIAWRILTLVHRLQEQFSSYFPVGDKSCLRLRTEEGLIHCLFPFLWRCLLCRNTANCAVIWRGCLTKWRILSAKQLLLPLSSKESNLCVAWRERQNHGREQICSAFLLGGVAVFSTTPCFKSPINIYIIYNI